MAGLSTIGGYFGGNAILGASILNGISLGTVGAGTSYASLSLLGKVSIFTAISASSLDGVFYFSNPETNKLEYKIKVSVPKELGSKNTRDLVNDIYKTNDEFNQAVENNDPLRQKHFAEIKEANNKYALDLLEYFLNNQENNQEDLLVLGIIAWNNGKYEQFSNAMNKIYKSKLNNTSFYNYLMALSDLVNGKLEESKLKLQNSIDENKFIKTINQLSPSLVYICNPNNPSGNLLSKQFLKKIIQNFPETIFLVDEAYYEFSGHTITAS
jgi:hypothetical protein